MRQFITMGLTRLCAVALLALVRDASAGMDGMQTEYWDEIPLSMRDPLPLVSTAEEVDSNNFFDRVMIGNDGGPWDLAFVKFHQITICLDCKVVQPGWDKLVLHKWGKQQDPPKKDWKVLIADVDCGWKHNWGLCENEAIQFYPHLKYYTRRTGPLGQHYDALKEGFDGVSLVNVVREQLGITDTSCNVKTKKGCTAEEVKTIKELATEELDKMIADVKLLKESRELMWAETDNKTQTITQDNLVELKLLNKKIRLLSRMSQGDKGKQEL